MAGNYDGRPETGGNGDLSGEGIAGAH